MTADLEAIRERAAKATPGPWKRASWHDRSILPEPWALDELPIDARGTFMSVITSKKEDAEFVAHARTDIPDLLTALDAALARIGELEERIKALEGDDESRHWDAMERAKMGQDDG